MHARQIEIVRAALKKSAESNAVLEINFRADVDQNVLREWNKRRQCGLLRAAQRGLGPGAEHGCW